MVPRTQVLEPICLTSQASSEARAVLETQGVNSPPLSYSSALAPSRHRLRFTAMRAAWRFTRRNPQRNRASVVKLAGGPRRYRVEYLKRT